VRTCVVKYYFSNKPTPLSFFFFIFLLCLVAVSGPLSAQVGINTEDPQGLLHVDAKSNTVVVNSNNVLNAEDDVVVTPQGRIGVGTTDPQARLDIRSATPGAIRIQDGTEGAGKALTSDADGVAKWTLPQVSGRREWYAYLNKSAGTGHNTNRTYTEHPVINYAASYISSGSLGSVDKTAGTITVPFTGRYLIALNTYDYLSRHSAPYSGRTILYVAPGGNSSAKTPRWTPSVWALRINAGMSFFSSAILTLTAGDVVSLSLDARLAINAHFGNIVGFSVEFIQP
jgi:hypothetical protein